MTRNLIALMLAGAMLAPVAAHAASSAPDYTRAGHKLAECLYTKRKADVLGLLNTTSAEEALRLHTMLRNGTACSNVTVNTSEAEGVSVFAPQDVMRGMLAEAALGKIGNADALAPVSAPASYQRDWFAATSRNPAVDEMAVCTAETNPAGVRDLLGTTPESPEELAAAQSLSATLGPCLPQGATLKANRQALRAALAEALYHRATAPGQTASK